jgi:hypothetical protein
MVSCGRHGRRSHHEPMGALFFRQTVPAGHAGIRIVQDREDTAGCCLSFLQQLKLPAFAQLGRAWCDLVSAPHA